MYNLNVNVAPGAGLLTVEGSCTTPKTPEILNSLIAMTSPFDAYPGSGATGRAAAPQRPGAAVTPGGSGVGGEVLSPQGDSCSSSSSCSSLNGSISGAAGTPPLGSPTGSAGAGGSPPSVQHTCSQLIKEGLKLTIQSKRRMTGCDPLDPNALDGPRAKMARNDELGACCLQCSGENGPCCHLTAEDEERRRRRRERNKIAATKCRLKKRERTVNLVHESEILETQNHELKNQIQDLETQRRRLLEMLNMHSPTCMKNRNAHSVSPVHTVNNGTPNQLSPTTPLTPVGPTSFCSTPPDVNTTHHQSNYCDPYHSYGSVSCNFGGAYSTGVDNGCMA